MYERTFKFYIMVNLMNIFLYILFLLNYFFICFWILKILKCKKNKTLKALSLILPLNIVVLVGIVTVSELYNIDFYKNSVTSFFYKGFSFLYIWFVPHLLTLIGLIGLFIRRNKTK